VGSLGETGEEFEPDAVAAQFLGGDHPLGGIFPVEDDGARKTPQGLVLAEARTRP